jgi:hypothetical protein
MPEESLPEPLIVESLPTESESTGEPPVKMSRPEENCVPPLHPLDVRADVEKRVRELALEYRSVGPENVWMTVKAEMNEQFPNGWHDGHTLEYVKSLVGPERKEMSFGDKFEKIKNTNLRFVFFTLPRILAQPIE